MLWMLNGFVKLIFKIFYFGEYSKYLLISFVVFLRFLFVCCSMLIAIKYTVFGVNSLRPVTLIPLTKVYLKNTICANLRMLVYLLQNLCAYISNYSKISIYHIMCHGVVSINYSMNFSESI